MLVFWMKVSLDETVFWMKVSVDEIDFGWKVCSAGQRGRPGGQSCSLFSVLRSPFSFPKHPKAAFSPQNTDNIVLFPFVILFGGLPFPSTSRRQRVTFSSLTCWCVWALFFFLRLRAYRAVSPARSGRRRKVGSLPQFTQLTFPLRSSPLDTQQPAGASPA